MNPTATVTIRRAVDADAASVQTLLGYAPPAADNRAVFVLLEDGVLAGAIDLVQMPRHLLIEAVVVDLSYRGRGHGPALVEMAETVGRELKLKEVRVVPRAVPFFVKFGYRDGVRRLDESSRYLEAMGVPLWRDGTATLGRSVYYRAVWAGLALIVGMGSIAFVVFGRGELTLAHLVIPAALCAAGSLFALWQLCLIVVAARRAGRSAGSIAAAAGALVAALLIGDALYEKAIPQLAELRAIYEGDTQLGDYLIEISPDGSAMRVQGAFATGLAKAVESKLAGNKGVRTIVLDGPGGRVGEGYALSALFRKNRLATHVQYECHSACTLAFLGGTQRSISQDAVLGFHQAGFPGMNAAEMSEANRGLERFLVRQGVTPAFAARVLQTPPNDVWVPSKDELKAGRVIHTVTP